MDQFDVKILNLVQSNNLLTSETIAEQVGLSASAVQRRLKRLRDERIIERDISVLSPDAIGRKVTIVVEVELEREQPQIIEEFKSRMLAAPEVMQCYYVTGKTDFFLIVTAKDMAEYEAFTQRFFFGNPHIRRFNTSVVMNRVKAGLMVPLD